jgi:hypothetical protein
VLLLAAGIDSSGNDTPNLLYGLLQLEPDVHMLPFCSCCHQRKDMCDGIFDDGEWMCGVCVARYVR